MIRTFRYSFVLAKIYGMLARTYVGRNYEDLLRLRKLEELASRIFPETRGAPTQPEGADELEERVGNASIRCDEGCPVSPGHPGEAARSSPARL